MIKNGILYTIVFWKNHSNLEKMCGRMKQATNEESERA